MAPAELSSLKDAFVTNGEWASYFARVLLAGIVAEVFVEFAFREDKTWREIVANVVCIVIVAVGVLGENHFGDLARDAARGLQANAERQVAEADARAAVAEEGTAQLSYLLALERSERLKIEEARADRHLSDEQKQEILEKLRSPQFGNGFPNTVGIFRWSDTIEAGKFANDFAAVFRDAGWTVKYGTLAKPGMMPGMCVETDDANGLTSSCAFAGPAVQNNFVSGFFENPFLRTRWPTAPKDSSTPEEPICPRIAEYRRWGAGFSGSDIDAALEAPIRVNVGMHPRGY